MSTIVFGGRKEDLASASKPPRPLQPVRPGPVSNEELRQLAIAREGRAAHKRSHPPPIDLTSSIDLTSPIDLTGPSRRESLPNRAEEERLARVHDAVVKRRRAAPPPGAVNIQEACDACESVSCAGRCSAKRLPLRRWVQAEQLSDSEEVPIHG